MEHLENLVQNKSLEEILTIRDSFELESMGWEYLNQVKAEMMELRKESTKEEIIYFEESDLFNIPEAFYSTDKLPILTYKTMKRSLLEYHPLKRHPIPYCIVKYKKSYFFALREKQSGEERLIGNIGLLGGHVGKEDISYLSLNKTILNGLKRELYEEAEIDDGMVQAINLKGLIKSNDGVDCDHLGIVYLVELNTKKIKTKEKGTLSGVWIHQDKLSQYYEKFESWARIIYDNVIKSTILG